ncbi:MAG: hypothetical protein Q8O97_01960 [bacterium]|nr:hypothetical protein [Candidatus Wildermuthbacteria bacterium]MDP2664712.1 hypothetical protein [bacterium]
MKYRDKLESEGFIPWQPSTWPKPSIVYSTEFAETLEIIIKETMLNEIENVISDAHIVNGSLEHRGHVVALALLCAVDSIAAYAFSGGVGSRYIKFITTFFPADYQPFADDIYNLYRNSSVHSWNLFEVGMWPGNEPIRKDNGSLSFGLLNFFQALKNAVDNFLSTLPQDTNLQTNSLTRYSDLKISAVV